jgi:hypothetical protein
MSIPFQVAAHYVGTVPNKLLGWISLYSVVETIICGVFLSSRIAVSTRHLVLGIASRFHGFGDSKI